MRTILVLAFFCLSAFSIESGSLFDPVSSLLQPNTQDYPGVYMGNPEEFQHDHYWNADFLWGMKVHLDQIIEVRRLGFFVKKGAGTQARMAIYTDNQNYPDHLLATSEVFEVKEGRNEVDARMSGVLYQADYWLMWNVKDQIHLGAKHESTGRIAVTHIPFGSALPEKLDKVGFFPIKAGPFNVYAIQ